MARFRRVVIAVFAAATVAIGTHVTAPPADAMYMSCMTRYMLADGYHALGDAWMAAGSPSRASYWYGRAMGVLDGC